MFLLIDLSKKDFIHLALFDSKQKKDKEFSGQNRELVKSINSFLKEEDLGPREIEGIMIVTGSGSFTSTRISAVVANMFGYLLKIPLLAISSVQKEKVQEMIRVLKQQPVGRYLSAVYSGEPNISIKKTG